MCGISAIIDPSTANVTLGVEEGRNAVIAMSGVLRHRGPDSTGLVALSGCTMGHTRLSIIDLAGGAQPMSDHSARFWITFNGEIFNFRELRNELLAAGQCFRTHSDTEVLLCSYREWGEACVNRLNGQFAFFIWDVERQTGFAARDRMGEKPFYWARGKKGEVIIASEIKAILASRLLSPLIDRSAVDEYLAFLYVPPDRTIYSNVFTLAPAHCLSWSANRPESVREWSYWTPTYSSNDKLDAREAAGEIRRLLVQAVSRQMVADVPVGAFLSGGLDSSTLVALMQRQSDRPVQTFSVGFGNLINELPFAKSVADQYRTHHRELQVDIGVGHLLERMAEVYDEPFADSSNIPSFLVAQFAAKHVKVAIAGDGGDELFGGYSSYRALLGGPLDGGGLPITLRRVRALAARVMNKAGLVNSSRRDIEVGNYHSGVKRRKFQDTWDWHVDNVTWLRLQQRQTLWRGSHTDDGQQLSFSNRFKSVESVLGIDRAIDFDIRCYLPGDILVKVDRAAMAHGLETRAPFLDPDLVGFALSLPRKLRFPRSGYGAPLKSLLRDACSDLWPVPLKTRGKQGFNSPVWNWIRRPDVVPLLNRVGKASSPLAQLLPGSPSVISACINGSKAPAGFRSDSQAVWSLLCLGLWLERRPECLNLQQ